MTPIKAAAEMIAESKDMDSIHSVSFMEGYRFGILSLAIKLTEVDQ